MAGVPHVQRVMVFGSVARGAAGRGSDIDLMVVVDDLGDYWDRSVLQLRMSETARRAVPFSVDVHVTDPPEWKVRTERVSASFEASLRGKSITLLERPALTAPDWGKQMNGPLNNLDVAANRFRDISDHIGALAREMLPEEAEIAGDEETKARLLKNRRRLACGHAANAVENAIKTVIAVHGVSPEHTHDVQDLVDQIPAGSQRDRINAMLASSGLPTTAASQWHVRAVYSNHIEQQWADAEAQMPGMIRLARDLAVYAEEVFVEAGGASEESGVLATRLAALERNALEEFGIRLR